MKVNGYSNITIGFSPVDVGSPGVYVWGNSGDHPWNINHKTTRGWIPKACSSVARSCNEWMFRNLSLFFPPIPPGRGGDLYRSRLFS